MKRLVKLSRNILELFLKHKWIVLDVFAIFFVGLVFAWTLAKIEGRLLPYPPIGEWWGLHSFSDFLTLLAGKRFYEEGFISNYFLPNMTVGYNEFTRGWYYYQVPQIVPNSAIYYTHYGSLDCIINGVLRYFGVTELKTFYIIAAGISVSSLALWYFAASMLFTRLVAFISLLFIGTSAVFLMQAETLGVHSYSFFLAFGTVFLVVLANKITTTQWTKTLAYTGAWLLTFLQANSNPEWLPWHAVFLWVISG